MGWRRWRRWRPCRRAANWRWPMATWRIWARRAADELAPIALFWGERAIALAERLGDHETLSYALNSVGAVEIASGDERGTAKLERSLAHRAGARL